MREVVEAQAAQVVKAAAARRIVDGVEVAAALPSAVFPDLVGWPRLVLQLTFVAGVAGGAGET